jgi:uncharacterized protein (DUF1501 family)
MAADNRVLAVLQLSGGNDALNTIVPYSDPYYREFRHSVAIPEDELLRIDDQFGFHPSMKPLKDLYDQGKMAVILGVGYPHPNRSHFRSMDIWHTCEPETVGTEGWLGRAIRDLDPTSDNVLTGVNFGRGLPRALAAPGVPVASVGNLETYGVLPGISGKAQRARALDAFARLYAPRVGRDITMKFLSQTGLDALKGADILGTVPAKYSSTVQYGKDTVARYMRDMARVHLAGLGTRILYTTAPYNSFDTHANQLTAHASLWTDVSNAITSFLDDLKEHNASDDAVLLVFTEFGRRVRDNGSGTDHGSGGIAFVIGEGVKGGLYGEYPSLAPEKQLDGDLQYNNDFRGVYATLLEGWLNLAAKPIVNGNFETFDLISARTNVPAF